MKRNTWQREAVREALGGSDGFVSAQNLHASLKSSGSTVGLATVYRALADLATEGEADSLQQDGESLYRACTPGKHHHHLRSADHLLVQARLGQVTDRQPEIEVDSINTNKKNAAGKLVQYLFSKGPCRGGRALVDQSS